VLQTHPSFPQNLFAKQKGQQQQQWLSLCGPLQGMKARGFPHQQNPQLIVCLAVIVLYMEYCYPLDARNSFE
jgi:hypothetical protein